jgi:hypothetical protein
MVGSNLAPAPVRLSEKLKAAEDELAERQVRDADLAAAADEVMALLDQINTIELDAPVEERRKVLEASVVGIDVEFATEQRGKRKKHAFLGGDMRIPEPLALAASYLPIGPSLVRLPG